MIEQGFHEDGSFRFHVPIELKKSGDGKVWVQGIASIQTPDIAGETVIQSGMDLNYLLSRGFFNDNHDKTSEGKVGIPTDAQITKNGLFVKGYMLDTPRAKGIVELAESLNKSGSDRRLGFSVEGKVIKRDGQIIQKSWIKDIAITAEPTHPGTYLDIVKSISADIQKNGYIDSYGVPTKVIDGQTQRFWSSFGDVLEDSVQKLVELKKSLPIQKSLEAGFERPASTGGGVLRKESAEADLHNLDIPQDEGEDEDLKKKKLTKSETLNLIMSRGYAEKVAEKMTELLFNDDVRTFLNEIKTRG